MYRVDTPLIWEALIVLFTCRGAIPKSPICTWQLLVVQNPRSLRGGLVGINTSIIKVFSNVFYIRQGAHSVNAALIVLTTIKQTTIRATWHNRVYNRYSAFTSKGKYCKEHVVRKRKNIHVPMCTVMWYVRNGKNTYMPSKFVVD